MCQTITQNLQVHVRKMLGVMCGADLQPLLHPRSKLCRKQRASMVQVVIELIEEINQAVRDEKGAVRNEGSSEAQSLISEAQSIISRRSYAETVPDEVLFQAALLKPR